MRTIDYERQHHGDDPGPGYPPFTNFGCKLRMRSGHNLKQIQNPAVSKV